ncbi:hypothetical protein B0E46_01560 [Rhodanobacter sp. B04]|uniref:DUF6600 domain-containing protein n=1 Tax=Rhodanobacter sp. B04 TaxID=1945860 RepID=UPI000987611F|nr:DUF6600 domain-containing protein [Rhodanobacter sp. B04]OOG66201.1 hypothetical protein B0E46_01560 [Rhodanobacter sp. B04]
MHVFAKILAPMRRGWRPLAIVLLGMAVGLAQAQAVDDNSADPPGRVARLSYMAGDLGFLPSGATDWSDANINRPLTTGDRLSTGQGGRAELELGGGTLRIADRTDLGLLSLDDQLAQVELTQGTLNLTVRQLDQGQSYEIDTPTVALVVDQPGSFRIDIGDNGGSTQVTAFNGDATVYGENNAQRTVHAGRSYSFVDSSLGAVAISDIGGGDAFDAWCSDRDNRYAQSNSSQYVSDDVVGAQDLDQYGSWQTTSDYGSVWFPASVAVDWAPYRNGHWAYIAPWGWTWVDDSPWGYAPYHYGRWAYVGGHWGWLPGPRGVRAIYAPALVAFVGGGGWSVGIGGGPVGWFPLGPGEIYNPWYRASRGYYSNVNITNIRGYRGYDRNTIINNINIQYNDYRNGRPINNARYANRDAPRGFSAMPGQAFAGGQRVQRNLLRVDQRQLASAAVLPRGTSLRPAPGGIAPPRSQHARSLPAGGFQREVVARHAPPSTRTPASFNNLAGPQRAATPAANVRVLNARGPAAQGNRSQRNLPPTSNVAAGVPMGMPQGNQGNHAEPRQGDLPSARFAHPQAGDASGRTPPQARGSMPRPDAGYGAGQDQRSQPRENRTLPQVPQIQRATVINQPQPAADRPVPRYESERGTRDDMQAPRNDNAPRAYSNEPSRPMVNEQPRPMAEPVRQNYQQPQYQQPQRSVPQYSPQPRAAAPAQPQHAEPRPAAKAEPRNREDDRQH